MAGALAALTALAIVAPARAHTAPGSAFARPLAILALTGSEAAGADSVAASRAEPEPALVLGIREDRWQHASLSFALVAAGGAAGLEPAPAAVAALALGIAKELLDARGGRFDPADLAADAAGALLAAIALGAMTR